MILASILLVVTLAIVTFLFIADAEGRTIYVDDDAEAGGNGGPERPYRSITDAVNNAEEDDLIRVFNGTYHGDFVVNVTLRIEGNASMNTTVIGSGNGNVVSINDVNTLISGLTITGSGSGSDPVDAGIGITADNCRILECTISGNGIGIYLDQVNSTIIRDSTITFNDHTGVYLNGSRETKLTNSTISDNTLHGVFISAGSHKTTIMNCTLMDNDVNGLLIHISNNTNISNSTFSRNTNGMTITGDSRQTTAQHNKFENNSQYGIDNSNNDGSIIEGTQNWWGSESGPFHPTLNANGTGDNVTDDVHFDPWIGIQVRKPKTLYVDDDAAIGGNGGQERPYRTIQDAIDNAIEGDIIRVFGGIYQENIVVNISMSLVGNGSEGTTIDWDGSEGTTNNGGGNEGTTIDGNGKGYVVTITADGVNLSGFLIFGSGSEHNDAGIRIESNHTMITNNTVTENRVGIFLSSFSRDNEAHFNSIVNNTEFGMSISEYDGDPMNAINNWWGDNSGPFHSSENIGGKGDTITDHVLFDPWLTDLSDQPPIANAGTNQTVFLSEEVMFIGTGEDPDGTIEKYEWDFDGDGIYDWESDSTGETTHVFTKEGIYHAVLRVTDDFGGTGTDICTITVIVDVKNEIPSIRIIDPLNNSQVSGIVTIHGTTSDPDGNGTIENVEVSIDNGTWKPATGTTSWTFEWDTGDTIGVENGNYSIRARSYDGTTYSDEVHVTITVDNGEDEGDKGFIPGFELVGVALAFGSSMILYRKKREIS